MEHTEPGTVFYSVEEAKRLSLKLDNAIIHYSNSLTFYPGEMVMLCLPHAPLSKLLVIIPDGKGSGNDLFRDIAARNKGKMFFLTYPGKLQIQVIPRVEIKKVSGFEIPVSDLPPMD